MEDDIFEVEPVKRFLILTDGCDYWADDFCVHQTISGEVGYVSLINQRSDGRHVVCDVHAPVNAVMDFGTEYTIESFRQKIDEGQEEMDAAAKEFIEAAASRCKTKLPDGYQ